MTAVAPSLCRRPGALSQPWRQELTASIFRPLQSPFEISSLGSGVLEFSGSLTFMGTLGLGVLENVVPVAPVCLAIVLGCRGLSITVLTEQLHPNCCTQTSGL